MIRSIAAVSVVLCAAPAAASDGARREVSFRDVRSGGDAAIIGTFGLPIGRVIRLEGRRATRWKTTNEATLEVQHVNGQDPPRRMAGEPVHVQVHNVDALPDGTVVLEGFEFARWEGNPAQGWRLAVDFQVMRVISPEGVVLKQRGPDSSATSAIEVATPGLVWRIRLDFAGGAHAQYGSRPGDGGYVPPGTMGDLSALARALRAAGPPAEPGADRLQFSGFLLCPDDRPVWDCPHRDVLVLANDAQQAALRRVLRPLEPLWQADEFGTRRFEELRRTHPILP